MKIHLTKQNCDNILPHKVSTTKIFKISQYIFFKNIDFEPKNCHLEVGEQKEIKIIYQGEKLGEFNQTTRCSVEVNQKFI